MQQLLTLLLLTMPGTCARAQQLPPVFSTSENNNAHRSPMVKTCLTPARIVWTSDDTG